jgi:phthiocerol/phenolphthiocerol synthesis type-I polyketide synthase E
MPEPPYAPIAIIGLSGRFPRASNVDDYWTNLAEGQDCISRFSDDELRANSVTNHILSSPNYVPAAPILDNVEHFDASFFGITPREAEIIDPQQRIFLECCWEALENAGYATQRDQERIGVFAGARTNTYLANIAGQPGLLESIGMFKVGLGNDLAFLSARVSHLLNLKGPSISVHTACSTSLVAVHLACESLRRGECRMALAGGAAVQVPHVSGYMYEEGSVLSADGLCRPFDASARGTVFGSGAGVVILKKLEDAIKDSDTIHAIVLGSAVNNDGTAKASFTAPSVKGQTSVISDALRNAGVEADAISYVECHATGTLLGDAIELRSLSKAFGPGRSESCAVGSVKGNVGHLDAASGIAGLIKVILSLKHCQIPPSLHYEKPNPQISFQGTRFFVNRVLRRWEHQHGPLRASVSAFGVGGTNAHLVLEEAPRPRQSPAKPDWELLVLSARTQQALKQSMRNLASHLQNYPEVILQDVASTLQVGRKGFQHRHFTVCKARAEAVDTLERDWREAGCDSRDASSAVPPLVFMFPGQGTQYLGMGQELYEFQPNFRSHFDRCSEILKPLLGFDLVSKLRRTRSKLDVSSSRELEHTSLAQPALFAIEYSLARTWMSLGVQPRALLGHSLGEFTAACVAGTMALEDALALVVRRGQLIENTPPGAMLAIAMSPQDLRASLSSHLAIAAMNGPDLTTVAGTPEEIAQLEQHLRQEDVPFQRLHNLRAFHSQLMKPALKPFQDSLMKVKLHPPAIPFFSNVTGEPIQAQQAQDPSYWVQQMRSPVQFNAPLKTLLTEETRILLEIGPGQTLRRLAVRHPSNTEKRPVLATMPATPDSSERKAFLSALGSIWKHGVNIEWSEMRKTSRRISLPTYPFERHRYWISSASKLDGPNGAKLPKAPAGLRQEDVANWFWIPSWKSTPARRTHSSTAKGPCLLFMDDTEVGAAISDRVDSSTRAIIRIHSADRYRQLSETHFELNPRSVDDYRTMLYAVGAARGPVSDVVHLFDLGKSHPRPAGGSHHEDHAQDTIAGAIHLLQAMISIQDHFPCNIRFILTNIAHVEKDDWLLPAKCRILALGNVLPEEEKSFNMSLIDVVTPRNVEERDILAKQLIEELDTPVTDTVVAYRGYKRWTRHFERTRLEALPSLSHRLQGDGAYLIIGGLGQVGLIIAEFLAKNAAAKLVLTGRRALPPHEQWSSVIRGETDPELSHRLESLLALEADGANVTTCSVDILNPKQLQDAIDLCHSNYGRLDGIIHAAGITNSSSTFSRIRDLSVEDIDHQAASKDRGISTLYEVIGGTDVPFVLCISSNSSIFGGVGLASYAAANCALNAHVTQFSERGDQRWIAASWDHWPEARLPGHVSELKHAFGDMDENDVLNALRQKHLYAIAREEAAQAIHYILTGFDGGNVVVSSVDIPTRLSSQHNADSPATPEAAAAVPLQSKGHKSSRPPLKNIYTPPADPQEAAIVAIWEDLLGVEGIGTHDDFFELGGHSLLAATLLTTMRSQLAVEVSLAMLFEGPTIAQIAAKLALPQ